MNFLKKDKLLHFEAGGVIYTVCHILKIHPIGAMMTVLLIAFAKEVIWDDYLEKGTPEFLDIIKTIEGGLFAMIILMMI